MPLNDSQLRAISRNASVVSAAAGTVIGGTIPAGFVRKVWRITVANPTGATLAARVNSGDAVTPLRTLLDVIQVLPGDSQTLGGDIASPLYVIRPVETAAPVTDNQVVIGRDTADSPVSIAFYDERA